MNTPTHILVGAAAFARPHKPWVTIAALLGGLVPDISLYVLAGWALFVQGIPPGIVFGTMYFSPEWMRVFSIDHGFLTWGAVLAFGIWLKRDWLLAFAGAGLLHAASDFLLHHDDARPQFWPLTDWVFKSPVSYWDSRYYGNIVAPLELALAFFMCIVLWRRFQGVWPRVAIGATSAALMVPLVMWGYFLAGGGAVHMH